MKKESQIDGIRNHLVTGHPINPMDALNQYGCFRLAAVVFNLKEEGLNIKTTMVKNGNKSFAEYRIIEKVSERLQQMEIPSFG